MGMESARDDKLLTLELELSEIRSGVNNHG